MNFSRNYGLHAVAVAIVIVGALVFGMSAGTLLLLGIALACPLMMIFMMHGMGGHGHGGGQDGGQDRVTNDSGKTHRRS
jgi:hypothetical protein